MLSLSSWMQLQIRQRRMWQLFAAWLLAYFFTGFSFAVAYCGLASYVDCTVSYEKRCITDCWEILYFSFTTQATVGYGDFAPLGVGRLLSAVQAVVGMGLNAVLLGVVVFKSLQRRTPVAFPDYLVYEFREHGFWFRYVNIDYDYLQHVSFKAYLITPLTTATATRINSYDTLTNIVDIPFDNHPERVPLNVAAMRSVSNRGNGIGNRIDAKRKTMGPIVLSPHDFVLDEPLALPITVTLEISGYFRTNAEPFFAQKSYGVPAIRCGAFIGINNHEVLQLKSRSEQVSRLRTMLNQTISTPLDECRRCPYHGTCVFDVASAIRRASTQSEGIDPAVETKR